MSKTKQKRQDPNRYSDGAHGHYYRAMRSQQTAKKTKRVDIALKKKDLEQFNSAEY